jgi:hypothetical protein
VKGRAVQCRLLSCSVRSRCRSYRTGTSSRIAVPDRPGYTYTAGVIEMTASPALGPTRAPLARVRAVRAERSIRADTPLTSGCSGECRGPVVPWGVESRARRGTPPMASTRCGSGPSERRLEHRLSALGVMFMPMSYGEAGSLTSLRVTVSWSSSSISKRPPKLSVSVVSLFDAEVPLRSPLIFWPPSVALSTPAPPRRRSNRPGSRTRSR